MKEWWGKNKLIKKKKEDLDEEKWNRKYESVKRMQRKSLKKRETRKTERMPRYGSGEMATGK